MKVKKVSTMTWDEAPDTIDPIILAKILGIGIDAAKNKFNEPGFPKIQKKSIGNNDRADKEVARLYIQGISIKDYPEKAILAMILFELKKLNKNREEVSTNEESKENETIYS